MRMLIYEQISFHKKIISFFQHDGGISSFAVLADNVKEGQDKIYCCLYTTNNYYFILGSVLT